jgi:hypothetical protein
MPPTIAPATPLPLPTPLSTFAPASVPPVPLSSSRSDIPEVLLLSHYGALISSFFDEGVLLSAIDKQQIIRFYLDRCLLHVLPPSLTSLE